MLKRCTIAVLCLLALPLLLFAQSGWRIRQGQQDIYIGSAIRPQVTDTADIGTSTIEWLNLYVKNVIVGSGGIFKLADGTAAAPSLTQSSDPDNGIYFGTNQVLFSTAGTARWQISASGHLLATTDNAVDIGANSATRPRKIWVADSVDVAGGAWTVSSTGVTAQSGQLTVGAGAALNFNGRSYLQSSADGLLSVMGTTGGLAIQVNEGTAAPTIGTCGTGAIKANSRNSTGGFTATGATACTVTFGTPAFTNTPNCKITATKAPTTQPYISAESGTAFTVSGMTAGDNLTVDFDCYGGV